MKHRIRWFGILPDGERVPRNRHMNGGDWGWDVTCSCGWETRTGGAIQERIREDIERHRWDVQHDDEEVIDGPQRQRVQASKVVIGDVLTDDYYSPPVTLTVTAIRGGSTFTFHGVDGDGTAHTLHNFLPTDILIKEAS